MLEQFLGPDDFRRGISNFLKAYKYSNAQTRDLWLELERVSSKGYNVTKIMDTWTKQKGYPVVEVCIISTEKPFRFVSSSYTCLSLR